MGAAGFLCSTFLYSHLSLVVVTCMDGSPSCDLIDQRAVVRERINEGAAVRHMQSWPASSKASCAPEIQNYRTHRLKEHTFAMSLLLDTRASSSARPRGHIV